MKLIKHKMAWNEPGKNDDKSPWSDKGNPADFESWLKKLNSKISGSGGGSGGDDGADKTPLFWGGILLAFFVVIYIVSGFFIVEPQEQAVILQFGKYQETVGSGPHWIPRIIDSAIVVDVQGIQNYSYSANMLTRDENIVDVAVAVQYRIEDPEAYLFNVKNPVISLQQATASSLRQVIGHTDLDEILTSGREQVSVDVREQLIKILGIYNTGIEITEVALQPAKAPDAVKDAFDDAIKAQEDEQRYINQAEAYRMQVIPRANGQKQRILADAKAYKEQVVLNSQGETARYLALLPEYQAHPDVTRERLYIGALQKVLSNSTKVFVDQKQGSNTLMYLPLDKLISKAQSNMKVNNVPLMTEGDNESAQKFAEKTLPKGNYGSQNTSNYGATQSTNPYGFLGEGNR